ncbi:MAG: ABC transporter permease [Nitrospirae bacterium]|nr:MAG: ABC transporter permease [Nitrospirota bacterium]
MTLFHLAYRNAWRQKARTILTVAGLAVVVLGLGLLRTTVTAWYAGVEASVQNRLITRHAASLSIHLPLAYRDRIAALPGVTGVSYANWFGGVYRDAKGFFPQFAVEARSYLDLYPEFRLTAAERDAFLGDRQSCIVGRKLAAQHGWKIGDQIPLKGSLYPGDWEFVVRGIYQGAERATDETLLLFHWDYLNERRRATDPDRANTAGWFVVQVTEASRAATLANAVDAGFANSAAETRTETEQAFQMGFVAMAGTLILTLDLMAVLLNGITLLVLANALAMSVRERTREYAVMKTLGFRPIHLAGLIAGESLLIAALGAAVGATLTIPACKAYGALLTNRLGNFFPVFALQLRTLWLIIGATLLVGLMASVAPILRVTRIRITEGLRHIG